ncbi:MAG: cobalamin B12-binding domain-containing protein [Burkholderiales bacterium]|nr:cobalamin B12-binding domain-containing protein [Burkholderiales bacterium]
MFEWRRHVTLKGWARGKRSAGNGDAVNQGAARDQASPVGRAFAENATPDMVRVHLASTIEGEIIPRLLLTHQAPWGRVGPPGNLRKPDSEDIIDFCASVLRDDGSASMYLESWVLDGATFEYICTELLAPAARHFGDLWLNDLLDFTDVTIGTWRLQQLMRDMSIAIPAEAGLEDPRKRILLSTTPGEQHSFGLSMVAEFFRRDAWEVTLLAKADEESLVHAMRDEWYAVVGLSLSAEQRIPELRKAIASMRAGARNRDMPIFVGGRVFTETPALAFELGADAVAVDAEDAVRKARGFLRRANWLS